MLRASQAGGPGHTAPAHGPPQHECNKWVHGIPGLGRHAKPSPSPPAVASTCKCGEGEAARAFTTWPAGGAAHLLHKQHSQQAHNTTKILMLTFLRGEETAGAVVGVCVWWGCHVWGSGGAHTATSTAFSVPEPHLAPGAHPPHPAPPPVKQMRRQATHAQLHAPSAHRCLQR